MSHGDFAALQVMEQAWQTSDVDRVPFGSRFRIPASKPSQLVCSLKEDCSALLGSGDGETSRHSTDLLHRVSKLGPGGARDGPGMVFLAALSKERRRKSRLSLGLALLVSLGAGLGASVGAGGVPATTAQPPGRSPSSFLLVGSFRLPGAIESRSAQPGCLWQTWGGCPTPQSGC